MRVVVVTNSLSGGGASVAALRLCRALGIYVDVIAVTVDGIIDNSGTTRLPILLRIGHLVRKGGSAILRRYISGGRVYRSYDYGATGIHKVINRLEPDLINLHWINGDFVGIQDIAKFKAPVIWTLHDCWPLLGSMHHRLDEDDDCSGYIGAGYLGDRIEAALIRRKHELYSSREILFACPSDWLRMQVKRASKKGDSKTVKISNIVELSSESRTDYCLRERYRINPKATLIFVGTIGSSSDSIKGQDLLGRLMRRLYCRENRDYVFVMAGSQIKEEYGVELERKVIRCGLIRSRGLVEEIIRQCSVSCILSRRETFSYVAAESILLGTPAIAWKGTGTSSVITDRFNGYLAEPYNLSDFVNGIDWCARLKKEKQQLSQLGEYGSPALRAKTSRETVVTEYIELCSKIDSSFKCKI